MPAGKALQLCPELIMIHPRHGLYSEYSDRVMSILQDTTPLVEQVSVDEAFLDVSDLPQPLRLIATGLQKRVADETQLPCSLGGATNKLVAKMANDYGKKQVRTGRAPRVITIIEPGEEQAFLAPLDIQALWGFGPKTAEKLHERGILRIGQLYELSEMELRSFLATMPLRSSTGQRGSTRGRFTIAKTIQNRSVTRPPTTLTQMTFSKFRIPYAGCPIRLVIAYANTTWQEVVCRLSSGTRTFPPLLARKCFSSQPIWMMRSLTR
jgi:nucleotidyltransferase/DNA polymerase involved in DNA repair